MLKRVVCLFILVLLRYAEAGKLQLFSGGELFAVFAPLEK